TLSMPVFSLQNSTGANLMTFVQSSNQILTRLFEQPGSGTGYVELKAPVLGSTNIALTLFDSLPAAGNECVQISNTGVLTRTGSACGGGGSSPPFIDTTAIVMGSGDSTKRIRFEVDGLTTSTTRVLTPQNADYILAGTNFSGQIFTTAQAFRPASRTGSQTY